jgi:hypothetical protein
MFTGAELKALEEIGDRQNIPTATVVVHQIVVKALKRRGK